MSLSSSSEISKIDVPDIETLAAKIGIPKFLLTRYIFQADSYYKVFSQRKRSGSGYRSLSAPSKELKGIQRWISVFLLRHIELPKAATAYRRGASIKRNADQHTNQDFVCSLDLENFFPTISAKRVFGIFKVA
jgi:hypothetical protein